MRGCPAFVRKPDGWPKSGHRPDTTRRAKPRSLARCERRATPRSGPDRLLRRPARVEQRAARSFAAAGQVLRDFLRSVMFQTTHPRWSHGRSRAGRWFDATGDAGSCAPGVAARPGGRRPAGRGRLRGCRPCESLAPRSVERPGSESRFRELDAGAQRRRLAAATFRPDHRQSAETRLSARDASTSGHWIRPCASHVQSTPEQVSAGPICAVDNAHDPGPHYPIP